MKIAVEALYIMFGIPLPNKIQRSLGVEECISKVIREMEWSL